MKPGQARTRRGLTVTDIPRAEMERLLFVQRSAGVRGVSHGVSLGVVFAAAGSNLNRVAKSQNRDVWVESRAGGPEVARFARGSGM